jgi:hypothetical protein
LKCVDLREGAAVAMTEKVMRLRQKAGEAAERE